MKIEHTDAYQLMAFADAIRPFVSLPKTELTAKVAELGKPMFDQLKRNGNSPADAIALMRATLNSIEMPKC